MSRFQGLRRAFQLPIGRRGVQRAVDDEIAFHIDARLQDLRRRGHDEQDARAIAIREFGDIAAARRELAAVDRRIAGRRARGEWWADLWRDSSLAVRAMRRQPVITAAIVVTVALGIGANAAIFTVMQAALLAPLPYDRPERLVHLWETREVANDRTEASYPNFEDWRRSTRAFSHLEGYDPTNITVAGGDAPTMLQGGRVTAGFFSMLGVTPAHGRAFAPGEDVPNAPRIAVLSDGYWRRQLGADRGVIGRSIEIDGTPHVVIGVLPAGFHFAPIGAADVWMPLDQSAETRAERSDHWLNVVARLRDGVTAEDARAELASVMRRLATAYPETNAGRGAAVVALRDQVVGDVRPLLLVLAGAVTLVLVIACANVAGLLLARAFARRREMAVRTALGASRRRLVRQLLTESVLLALIGCVAAVWLAGVGAQLLIAAIPEGTRSGMPYWSDIGSGVSGRTALYAVVVALTAGVGFGLAPAVAASRASVADVLRQGGRGMTGGRGWMRDALVVTEVALTIVLLVGTGLLVRSLRELLRTDRGFDAEQVMTARVALAGPRYATDVSRRAFFDDVLERVREAPGVTVVGAVTQLPLNGGGTNTFRVEGAAEPPSSRRPEATLRGVAGDYFEAMGIGLVDGRRFTARDNTGSTPVIMINASLARSLFGGGRAVGERFRFYAFPEQAWEIVGVVRDVKTGRLDAAPPPTVYYSHLQAPDNRLSLAVRAACPPGTAGAVRARMCEPASLAAVIRRAVSALDPTVPVYAVTTMEEQVTRSPAVFARRYPLLLVGLFAATALVLAVVGLYGSISYAVVQRTREFGVRMALGATPGDIRRAVVRRGTLIAGTGIVLGVPGAFVLTRALRGMLYGVAATDVLTYLGACVVLGAVALVASYLPARRATRIEPTVALRAE
ncbi:MAG TPA: ABC transporter permease [Gemmatimonadaceae bacterium]|nr:ABC transporter permease [Gemmatimonadaceae bacterium]